MYDKSYPLLTAYHMSGPVLSTLSHLILPTTLCESIIFLFYHEDVKILEKLNGLSKLVVKNDFDPAVSRLCTVFHNTLKGQRTVLHWIPDMCFY